MRVDGSPLDGGAVHCARFAQVDGTGQLLRYLLLHITLSPTAFSPTGVGQHILSWAREQQMERVPQHRVESGAHGRPLEQVRRQTGHAHVVPQQPRKERELARIHVGEALRAGLSMEIVTAIPRSDFSVDAVRERVLPLLEGNDREVAIAKYASELLETCSVSDETYAEAKAALGYSDPVLVEVVAIVLGRRHVGADVDLLAADQVVEGVHLVVGLGLHGVGAHCRWCSTRECGWRRGRCSASRAAAKV